VGRQWRLAFFHLKNRQAENRFKSVFTADCFVSLGKAKSYWRAGGINAAAIAAIPYIPAFSMTESIQDTSPRIHPWRNKKSVSDETCPPNLSVGSMLQSKI